jgi:diguanylate cyclase (GGDEF)-like protein
VSLRSRLWIVLAALFLLPLIVGGLLLLVLIPGVGAERVSQSARTAASSVANRIGDECRMLGLAARNAALEAVAASSPRQALAVVVDDGHADYAALLSADASVSAQAGRSPVRDPADLAKCSAGQVSGAVIAERVRVDGLEGVAATVVARDLAGRTFAALAARAGPGAEVVLLLGGEVVASTSDKATTRALARATEGADRAPAGEGDGWVVQSVSARPLPYTVLVGVPEPSHGVRVPPLLLILVAAALAAGLLVRGVARDLSRPYAELTEAAERLAQGDLDATVDTDEEGEAGRLGSALSLMTEELRRNVHDLERSRQELRDSLERIGDTLTATHDVDGLLHVVLDTAMATVGGDAGVVLHRGHQDYLLVAEQGIFEADLPAPATVRLGDGVLGQVVATGSAVRGRIGDGPGELTPAANEPSGCDVLAVPLRSMGAVVGAIALYRRCGEDPTGREFDTADEDALGTLAGQASIALDNVQLHQEAQRLSTTDPLTGVWNFRYLSMSLAREIERSNRFDRPLAVLMLDLDHFKQVNDTYGHARGDAVLRELAERVQEQIREVDTFARYGGEEFVVVLPETTLEGAAQLAERICAGVRRAPFRTDGEEPLEVTISIGGAAFPIHGSSPATLMRAADKALYEAKALGRDRWHVAEPVQA